MSKIRSDIHGAYIRTGGYVFRPVLTRYSTWPGTAAHGQSGFAVGDVVKARHIAGTGHARVKSPVREEIWNSHGCYYDTKDGSIIPSDELWIPR